MTQSVDGKIAGAQAQKAAECPPSRLARAARAGVLVCIHIAFFIPMISIFALVGTTSKFHIDRFGGIPPTRGLSFENWIKEGAFFAETLAEGFGIGGLLLLMLIGFLSFYLTLSRARKAGEEGVKYKEYIRNSLGVTMNFVWANCILLLMIFLSGFAPLSFLAEIEVLIIGCFAFALLIQYATGKFPSVDRFIRRFTGQKQKGKS